MKKTIAFIVFTTLCLSNIYSQKATEKEAIKSMCGCFDVQFEYAETFARDTTYRPVLKPYKARAVEYVTVAEESAGNIVLQHLLVVNDSMVIKHWRQDWEYQTGQLFNYEGSRTWTTQKTNQKSVRGQWAQKVFEVDDSPRYAGSATWIFADGKKVWENKTDAPLPRREYTKRSDYHIMRRNNRHEITPNGWLHEQDNEKVVVNGAVKNTLVEEKGMNTYVRTNPEKCKKAADWWNKNEGYWKNVRMVWSELLRETKGYTLAPQIDGVYLGQALDKLSQATFKNDTEARQSIRTLIEKYMTKTTLP